MKCGYLSQYFDGLAAKTLSAVEADGLTSNQHEFNGVKVLQKILGDPEGKQHYEAKFLYLTDIDDDPILEDGFLTWYDAREKARLERGVMRREYRLYFSDNTALQLANEGDILIIAKCLDNTLLAIVAEAETTIAQQVLWLFGFSDLAHPGFSIREELETEQDRVEFASRFILESIGITVEATEETFLDDMLSKFGHQFPPTKIFSEYARASLPEVSPRDNHDAVLMAWIEREEILFRTMEKHLIGERLSKSFDGDVDAFLSFSLSIQNRRKSRAGLAFENHLEALFQKNDIHYSRNAITENKSKPDFIFPSIKKYHDLSYNSDGLTMLGVKSTCKDRWRQVLTEAERINKKHLLTLEVAISHNQTEQMKSKGLQLIVPEKLHNTYNDQQQQWLMNVAQFTEYVFSKQ